MPSYMGSFAGGAAQGLKSGFQLGQGVKQNWQDNQSADIVGGALKDWSKKTLEQGTVPQNVPVPGATPTTGLQQSPIQAMPQAAPPPPQAPMPGQPSTPMNTMPQGQMAQRMGQMQQGPGMPPGMAPSPQPGPDYGGQGPGPAMPQADVARRMPPVQGPMPTGQQQAPAQPQQPMARGPFSPDTLEKLITGESNGKNVLNALGSGASGPAQFMPATAASVAKGHPELKGVDPNSDAGARAYAQAYAQDNAQALKFAGIEPTQGALLLAHQQGAGGAIKLLKYPDARAADLVGSKAVVMNGGSPNMSAREFAQKVIGYYDGQKGGGGQGGHPEDFQGNTLPMTGQGGPLGMQQLVGMIMARNPNISNAALARAVERMSPLLNNEAKAAYNQQLLDFKYQQQADRIQMLERQLQSREGIAADTNQTRREVAQTGAESREKVAATNAGARVDAAQIAAAGRMDVAKLNNTSRETVAEIREAGRRDVAEMQAKSREKIAGDSLGQRQKEFDEKIRQFDERQSYLQQKLEEETEAKQAATEERKREHDQRIAYLRDALDVNKEMRSKALDIQAQNADTGRGRLEETRRHNAVSEDQGDRRLEQGTMRITQSERRMDETERHNQRTEAQGDRRLDQQAAAAAAKSVEFQQKEARLSAQFRERQDMAEKKLAAAKDDKDRSMAFKEYESALKEYNNKVRELIDSDYKMSGPDKKVMQQKLTQEMEAAQREVDEKKLATRGRPPQPTPDGPVTPKDAPARKAVDKGAVDIIKQMKESGAENDAILQKLEEQGYDTTELRKRMSGG